MSNKVLKKVVLAVFLLVFILVGVFVAGRYGWKLGGFAVCEGAGIEQILVEEEKVTIQGYYPGISGKGFIGCYSKQEDGTLYVGFKFSHLFGFFETGDFTISIETEKPVTQVYIKTAKSQTLIWSQDGLENQGTEEHDSDKQDLTMVYEPILEQYYKALSEQWTGQQLMDEGIYFMLADCYGTDPLNNIGYSLEDLDGDGSPELAIGTTSGEGFYSKLILTLYTLQETGEPYQLFESQERNTWYYMGNNMFANVGSSSASESFNKTWKLDQMELVSMSQTSAEEDYEQMALVPFGNR